MLFSKIYVQPNTPTMKKLLCSLTFMFFILCCALAQSVIVNPDGTHSILFDNGATSTLVNPNGTHSVIFNNGNTSTVVNPDGTHSTIFHNGDVSTMVNPNGTHSTIFHHGSTSTVVNPDGTHTIVMSPACETANLSVADSTEVNNAGRPKTPWPKCDH